MVFLYAVPLGLYLKKRKDRFIFSTDMSSLWDFLLSFQVPEGRHIGRKSNRKGRQSPRGTAYKNHQVE